MNVLSLFAGIGGLDLGLERAGMTVTAQVEVDEFCQKVLRKNFGSLPLCGDIQTFNSMLSAEGFRAKTFLLPVRERGWKENVVDCGGRCYGQKA